MACSRLEEFVAKSKHLSTVFLHSLLFGGRNPSLIAGESCALAGVGNSPKSNFARRLARADVRLRYFGADAAQTIVVYLNCTPLAHGGPHDLYLQALGQLDRAQG